MCDDLISEICSGCSDTVVEAECIAELDAEVPCNDAVDVSAEYDACLAALDSQSVCCSKTYLRRAGRQYGFVEYAADVRGMSLLSILAEMR